MSSLKKIGCKNCGAEVVFDPATQLSNCNFCGSTYEIETAKDESSIEIDGILPFSVSKEDYQRNVYEFLSEGDYTPDDILTSTIFESVTGSYLPMWLYSGKYEGNWSASSGYRRIESYVGRDSNGRAVEKTRTVTDWRPSNGNCNGEYTVFGFAGDNDAIKPTISDYAHGTQFSRGAIKDYEPQYTTGFTMLDFKNDEHDTWDFNSKSRAEALVRASAEARIPGDTFKDFYVEAVYHQNKSLRTYVPFWITTYKYGDEEFYVYMDGTNQDRLQGLRPEDNERKALVKKKFWPGHITLALVLIIVFAAGGFEFDAVGWFLVIAIVVAYGWGFYEKSKIINASKKARQEILENFK